LYQGTTLQLAKKSIRIKVPRKRHDGEKDIRMGGPFKPSSGLSKDIPPPGQNPVFPALSS
jgi:hypothetical protein